MKSWIFLLIGFPLSFGISVCTAQTFEWAKRIGGTGEESCRTIALDNQGNIYLAGTFHGSNVDFDPGSGTGFLSSSGGADIFMAKYDPDGNYLWAKKIGGTGEDIPAEIVVDKTGDLYLAGWFESASCDFDPGSATVSLSSAGYGDLFFAKYDTGGNYLWAKRIGGTGHDGCHDIHSDESGNIFITGYFQGVLDFDPGAGIATLSDAGGGDLFFAKFDPSGNYLWAKKAGGSQYEVGNGINTDNSGNIYISGPFLSPDADFDPGSGQALLSSAGGYDIYLAKYDASGNYLWVKRTGGPADEIGGNIEFDSIGNVYVLGVYKSANIDFDPGPGTLMLSSAGGWDLALSKFTADGNLLTANGFGGTGDDYYTGLSLDPKGNVYLSGNFSNSIDLDPGSGQVKSTSTGLTDSFYAKFNAGGEYAWSVTIGGRYTESGGPVAYDSSGYLCTVMGFNGSGVDMDPGPGTAFLNSAGATDLAILKFSLKQESDTINQIAFSNTGPDGNNEIYTVHPDGTGLTRLTVSPVRECGPAWSPDGLKIAYYVHYDHYTWSEFIMDADGRNSKRLTNTPNVCDGPPAWSPDGKFIAFGRWYPQENYRAELWMMNADGTNIHRVGNFSGDHPHWSPNGSKLVISYQHNNRSAIATVNPDGTGLTEISADGTENWWPAWSPDGSNIAFQSNRSGDHEIYVIRSDGSNPVRLTDHPGEDGEPDWSPDGQRIAYSSMVDGRYEIKVMNTRDARPSRLVNMQLHNINPAWKPLSSASWNQINSTGVFEILQGYPNPTGGLMMIGYNLDKKAAVVINVTGLTGHTVYSQSIGIKDIGKHSQALDLTNLTPGLYFYTLTCGNQSITRKFVKN